MILVDMSHLFFRNFWMNKDEILVYEYKDGEKVATDINVGYISHLMLTSVLMFAKKFNTAKNNDLVIALDSKPSWRHEYYVENSKKFPEYQNETYKGDRKKDDTIPWNLIFEAMDGIYNLINEATDFVTVKAELAEADDVIAVLANTFKEREEIIICSSDKDFWQLQDENVTIYDPMKKIFIPKIDVEFHKTKHALLGGDDNIKQVKKGVGEKTAEKWIREGLDNILKINPEIRERYEFNRVLTDFNYIPDDVKKNILASYETCCKNKFNGMKLMNFFTTHQMRNMLNRIQEFNVSKRTKQNNLIKQENPVDKVVETSIEDFFS